MRFLSVLAAIAACVSSLPALAQDCSGWVPLSDPLRRSGAAIAFDALHQNLVMFGGEVNDQSDDPVDTRVSETWTFDGTRWNFVTLAGPARRANAAMCFDTNRNVMVLFGGRVSTTGSGWERSDETWEFDGSSWTLVATGGPPAREFHAMAFDPVRNQTVLYGSSNALHLSTWLWNGAAWTEVQTPGPTQTYAPAMAWDPTRNQIVLVGIGDSITWGWNGSVWSQLVVSPSTVATSPSLFFDPARNALTVVSGNRPYLYRTLDGDTWSPPTFNPVLPVLTATFHLDPVRRQLLAFCPSLTLPADTTRTIEWPLRPFLSWIAPPRRNTHPGLKYVKGTFDSGRGVVVFVGGIDGGVIDSGRRYSELRGERLITYENLIPEDQSSCGFAYDPRRRVSVAQGRPSGSTLELNGLAWTNRGNLGGPLPSLYPAMCDNPSTQSLLHLADFGCRSFDGISWQFQPSPPVTLTYTSLAFDPIRNAVVAAGSNLKRTFSFAGGAWTEVGTRDSTNGWLASTCYDPTLGGILLAGGFSYPVSTGGGAFPRETFLLPSTGSAWQQLPTRPAMVGRKDPVLVYDSLARRTIFFGGYTQTTAFSDLWKLASGPAAIELHPTPVHALPGHYVEIFGVASGGGVLRYQWNRDGVPLADSPRWSGNRTDTLIIPDAQPQDVGDYTLTVSNPCGSETSNPALVAIGCLADWNADGVTDSDDIVAFFTDWDTGNADLTADNDTDSDDILTFFQLLDAGC